jgi:hypothetical protein
MKFVPSLLGKQITQLAHDGLPDPALFEMHRTTR